MENYEYLAGSTRPPFTLAEIILFLTVIYLFMGTGGNWQILLAVLLLIYWFALMAGKLWPPPKFDFPATPLVRKSSTPNAPTKANFVWSPEYKVGFWWHFPPVKKYVLIHHKAIEEKILTEDDFIKPTPLRDQDLALVHGRGYLWRLYLLSITPLGFLNGENPISFKILKKLKIACGGTYKEAETLYKKALAIWEKALYPDDPAITTVLKNMIELYKHLGKLNEVIRLEKRLEKIRSNSKTKKIK